MLEFESYDGISIPSCRFENGEFPNSYFEEIGFFFFFSLLKIFLSGETNLDFSN